MLNENKCHGFSSAVLIVKVRKQTNPDVNVETPAGWRGTSEGSENETIKRFKAVGKDLYRVPPFLYFSLNLSVSLAYTLFQPRCLSLSPSHHQSLSSLHSLCDYNKIKRHHLDGN